MQEYWKRISLAVIGIILWIVLDKREKDISMLLSMAVCSAIVFAALEYVRPVLDLIRQLTQLGNLQDGTARILLKAVGIGMVTELVYMLCKDAGNDAMGCAVRFLGSSSVLYVTIPAFQAFLSMIQEILRVI